MGRHSRSAEPASDMLNVIDLTNYRIERQLRLFGSKAAEALTLDTWPATEPDLATPAQVIDITGRLATLQRRPYLDNPRLQGILDRFGIDPWSHDLDRWKRPETD